MGEAMGKRTESHRGLRGWQRTMDLVVWHNALTAQIPNSEQYGVTSQMRRASISLPANILEGRDI